MITEDLAAYAKSNWQAFQKSAREISEDEQNHIPLVKDETQMFCFDDIIKSIFPQNKKPDSADAIYLPREDTVLLIEFKRGFQRKLTKANWSKDHPGAKCEYMPLNDGICKTRWDLFWKLQDKEVAELNMSIRFKAVESYLALKRLFFPFCDPVSAKTGLKLKFWTVIDVNPLDGLTSNSTPAANKNDPCVNLRASLERLTFRIGESGQPYLYDEVDVIPPQKFKIWLERERLGRSKPRR